MILQLVFAFISSFPFFGIYIYVHYFTDAAKILQFLWMQREKKLKLKICFGVIQKKIKSSSKARQNRTWQEPVLNFGQWNTFSEKCKPIRVFTYYSTRSNCFSRHFIEFIQPQKWNPTFLDNISILTRILEYISSQNFSRERNCSRTYSLPKTSYLFLRL